MIFIGIDPDVHHTSVVAIDNNGKVVGMTVIEVPKKFKGFDGVRYACALISKTFDPLIKQFADQSQVVVLALENQEVVSSAMRGVNPGSMLPVAQAAGAMMMAMHIGNGLTKAYAPKPQEWKGSVPKQIHQARVCKKAHWEYDVVKAQGGYCRPTGAKQIITVKDAREDDAADVAAMVAGMEERYGRACWKHVLDALGLAQWAQERYALECHQEKMKGLTGGQGSFDVQPVQKA